MTSYLDYCNAVLYGLPNKILRKLQLQLNVAARLVSLTPLRSVNILPRLFVFFIGSLSKNAYNSKSSSLCISLSIVHPHSTLMTSSNCAQLLVVALFDLHHLVPLFLTVHQVVLNLMVIYIYVSLHLRCGTICLNLFDQLHLCLSSPSLSLIFFLMYSSSSFCFMFVFFVYVCLNDTWSSKRISCNMRYINGRPLPLPQ